MANFALIVAFFTFIPFVEKRDVGSVYTRNGLIPLIAAMNFASQVMVFHVHYYYGNYCYPTCCNLRKASYGLAITSLILSIFAFVDLVVDNSKKSATVPINEVVPVQSSHVEYIEEPGHYNYVQQAPTQVKLQIVLCDKEELVQDVYHHPNGAVTVNPPQYHDPIPVYQKGKVKEVVVVTENYVVTPVNQGNSSSGTDMFTITHIARKSFYLIFFEFIKFQWWH